MSVPSRLNRDPDVSRNGRLSQRLESLETQVARLADLLASQGAQRQRRRRTFTLRFTLAVCVAFAILFAWFGSVYHRANRQRAAVDRLIGQGAFVLYGPRDDALVSLMPGEIEKPPQALARWLGDDFFRAVTNVSTANGAVAPGNKAELMAAVPKLDQLQRLRLTGLGLKTTDLHGLSELTKLQSLDLTRTGLDRGRMPWLASTRMRWFNASHTNLSDGALYDLSFCPDLQMLYLERTAISDQGLKHLQGMRQLRYLNLKRCPVSASAVKRLADTLPLCMIEWEPLKFLPNGRVDARAASQGRVRYGRMPPADPRASRRAVAPLDSVPRINTNTLWPTYPTGSSYVLDVF